MDLAALRRSYERGGLAEEDLAPTWHEQLERWLRDAHAAGVNELNAMTLATVGEDGRPSARTVLLKGLDERGLVLFTNLRSRKGREALATGHAAVVLPWVDLDRQVVVTGAVERVDDALSDAYFSSRPRGSQLGAVASPQSQVVGSRAELEALFAAAEKRFAGQDVERPAHWGGLRVVPDAVEFWQGRRDRLHDRLRFRCPEPDRSDWIVERLAP